MSSTAGARFIAHERGGQDLENTRGSHSKGGDPIPTNPPGTAPLIEFLSASSLAELALVADLSVQGLIVRECQ